MLTASRTAASLLLLLSVFTPRLRAQEKAQEGRTAPIVTAAVRAERIRFTAPSSTVAVRLEVYAADGRRLFDSGFKPGTLLDWAVLDQQGQPYPAGAYLCVVAVKSLSGRVSHKLGALTVSAEGTASLEPAEAKQLSAAQLQASGGAESGSALTVLREGEATAVTSIAHTGTEGEITRGKGALSFRLGDFHGGKDVEQMRLTREGNLGIGTASPRARLDVNGVIRAQGGIQFNDGTLLNLSPKGGLSVTSPDGATNSFGATTTALAGTGTQNRLAKWTDNSGTLGDSSIIEDGRGTVIIGSTSPDVSLQVNGNQFVKPAGATPSFRFLAGFDPARTVMLTTDGGIFGWQMAPAKSPSETLVQVLGQTYATAAGRGEFGVYLGTNAGSAFKVFRRGGPELMRVNRSGNVGIGTAAPASRLHVAGDLRVSGTGSGIVFPDGTKQTTAGGGGRMTGTSIVSAINDAATTGTINDSRLSYNVALLGNANFFNNDQFVNGSVGIGTRAPGERLEVAGSVKLSGAGSGVVFPDGTKQTTAAGGGSYIQNTTAQQANSNFNVSGDGTAGGTLTASTVHARANYYLRGAPVLRSDSNGNLLVGNTGGTGGESANTFVGLAAGQATTGHSNTFVGYFSGSANAGGSQNTLIGADAQVQGSDLTNATAIGYRAAVAQSNSIVLGRIYDTRVGIGTPAPQFKLHVTDYSNTGLRVQTEIGGGTVASFGGHGEFQVDSPGVVGGRFVVKENGNVGIGWANPNSRLDVNGMISFSQLGAAGQTALCLNGSNQISSCSSSLRYKTNVAGLSAGLNLINRLRPVTFDWKEGKAHDLGLIAEEVAAVEPLLVLHNQKGEVEGVKYDRLNVVLVNAVKEQQAQIRSQADALAALRQENLEMKRRLASLEQSLRQPR